jgi:acyl-CoA dehydrogenase
MADPAVTDTDFRDILDATRQFIRSAVMPRELEIMTDNRVPDDIRDQAKKMGLFGYAIPQEWGGLGLNIAQDVEMAMEFGYTTLALRSMFGTNNGIAGQVLVGFGTNDQKTRWLDGIASGQVVASFALTEPGAGSNPAGLRTKAVRDGAGADAAWVITGQKRFITNAPTADLFVVFARSRPADSDGPGIAVFLVPADAEGVAVGPKDAKMGQEGAWTSDVSFDGVRVGADALIGGARGRRLPRCHDVIGARSDQHRGAGGRCGTARSGRVGELRSRRDPGRPRRSATSNWYRRCSPTSKLE